jgi:hypothetical protein
VLPEELPPAAAPDDDPDAAVVLAVWLDVVDVSPGNCRGISGLVDAEVAPPPVAPVLELLVPPPLLVPCDDDGKGVVGTLSGSVATAPLPELV